MNERIDVTKTFLPPRQDFDALIDNIWDSGRLTNQGPLLREFEAKTSQYLNLNNFQFVQNGTLALQVALKALEINDGEVITTPFSYVATTSAILWQNCTPIFVDINASDYCIDVTKIEDAITNKTKAILAVHVYGHPCDVEAIDKIAKKHKLKVIYDGAHAFGVTYKGKSLLDYGDISTCSFHATKIFHTVEGGAIIAKDNLVNQRVELIKRFGHNGDDHLMLGINAKASEFHAAMGLCNLKYIDEIIQKRRKVHNLYNQLLGLEPNPGFRDRPAGHNYSYYPVLIKSEDLLLRIKNKLEEKNIYPRRYFYPSLNELPYLKKGQACPIAESISRRILCLPLYPDIRDDTVIKICEVILNEKGLS